MGIGGGGGRDFFAARFANTNSPFTEWWLVVSPVKSVILVLQIEVTPECGGQ